MNRYGRRGSVTGGKIERVEPVVVHLADANIDGEGPSMSWCGRRVSELEHVLTEDGQEKPEGARECRMCCSSYQRHQRGGRRTA